MFLLSIYQIEVLEANLRIEVALERVQESSAILRD